MQKIQVLFQLNISSPFLWKVFRAISQSYVDFTSKQCCLLTIISLTKAALT